MGKVVSEQFGYGKRHYIQIEYVKQSLGTGWSIASQWRLAQGLEALAVLG